MSLVRYTNKKTGVVTIYESTSHYDPVTKQSRPIRKYLGVEDPETGKIIPSSGNRDGRRQQNPQASLLRRKKDLIINYCTRMRRKQTQTRKHRLRYWRARINC